MSSNIPTTNDLLAAAFSSLLKTPVISQAEFNSLKKQNPSATSDAMALNLQHLYKHTYKWAPLEGCSATLMSVGGAGKIQVFVKTLTGQTKEVFTTPQSSIAELKNEIEKCLSWPVEQQRLIYGNQQLENDKTVSDYSIGNLATLHIVMMLPDGGNALYYLDGSLLAPNYDYDFTGVNDGDTKFYRGTYVYTRPCGWQRKAMKVVGQYSNDVWLGGGGIRTETTAGEWPVSYHSSASAAGGNIAQEGSKQCQDKSFTYSRGIFTTPLATVAARYAPTFDYKGQKYQVIFQNRVNPETLQRIESSGPQSVGEFWISQKEDDIRPYNICLKKVSS